MNRMKLEKLAAFVATLNLSIVEESVVERPAPQARETFIVQRLWNRIKGFIGNNDADKIEKDLALWFREISEIPQILDEIWDRYGSDESFFAFLRSMFSTFGAG